MSDIAMMNKNTVNGLDLDALRGVIDEVGRDPATGVVEFRVRSAWKGQTRSESVVDSYTLGGKRIAVILESPPTNLSSCLEPIPRRTRRNC